MLPFDINTFLKVAVPPKDGDTYWLEHATDGVEYLRTNARSPEIILYTTVGQSYVHAVLAPLAKVTPPDGDDLQRAHIGADNGWVLEHSSGGGQPDRMYLSDPLDSPGCNSLAGASSLFLGAASRALIKVWSEPNCRNGWCNRSTSTGWTKKVLIAD